MRKRMERGKFAHQAVEVSTPPADGEGEPATYDTDDKGEDDPMVSEPIRSFAVKAKITAPKTGAQEELQAIINTGCTRCLINLLTVLRLEIWMKKMT